MRRAAQVISLTMLMAGSACQDLERTRAVDNPAVTGKTIAMQVCSNCHGMKGDSTSPTFPKLAGQRREYLVEQLLDFKTHARADLNAQRYMWGFTHLTDAQIDALAAYFSSQSIAAGEPAAPALMSAGRHIYVSGLPSKGVAACVACHGQYGEGMDKFPRIGGQHADYVLKQLEVFRQTNDRPHGEIMKAVCANMSDYDMRAVAAFVEAFPAEGVLVPTPPAVSAPAPAISSPVVD